MTTTEETDNIFQNKIEEKHIKNLSEQFGLEIDSIEFRVGNLPKANFTIFEIFPMVKSLKVARAVVDSNGRVLSSESFFSDSSKINNISLESTYSALVPICAIIRNKEPSAEQYNFIFMEGSISKKELIIEEPELLIEYTNHRIEEIVNSISHYEGKNFI